MSKYIIKNCPCRMDLHEDDCFGHTGYYNCCACTDCVMKQVIDKCKETIKIYNNEEFYEDDADIFMGESNMASVILDMFNIQEVE